MTTQDRHADIDRYPLPSPESRTSDGTTYVIRSFRPTDVESIRDLYEQVAGKRPTPEWLNWKFRQNPARRHGCLLVAASDDEMLGLQGLYPVNLRFGERTVNATCLVNIMIHPDFRGEGLVGRINDYAMEYLSTQSDLVFTFANNNSRPIFTHWGWSEVTRTYPFFRFQQPAALLSGDHWAKMPMKSVSSLVGRGYLGIRRQLAPSAAAVTVSKTETAPADRLAALYRRAPPEALHVVRDEAFYRWRLGSPDWSGAAYIAHRDGEDLAALVVKPQTLGGGATQVDVIESVPLVTDGLEPVFAALLDRVIADHPDVDVLSVPSTSVPDGVLKQRGFVWSGTPPLSWLYTRLYDTLTLFIAPGCTRDSSVDVGADVSEPESWVLNELTRNTN